MKIVKRLLPAFLFALVFLMAGCSSMGKSDVKEVITSELDLLKNLDSEKTQEYVSYKELFPNTKDMELSAEVKEVFSLFFRNFDYKIQKIQVDKKQKTASASVKLSTLDAQSLAEDFAALKLKTEIEKAASSKSAENFSDSTDDNYRLLNQLLKKNKYETTEEICTITLHYKNDAWIIDHSNALENDLVGDLITYLADPDILSPEETMKVYLKTLKKMELEEINNFLGIESLLASGDTARSAIASALVEQVHTNFNYKITESTVNGYTASVKAEITTFDSDSILDNYHEKLNDYLSSADAVIDGSEKRYLKSYELLLETIEKNEDTITASAVFHLVNDGASWKLKDASTELGNAIFGTLITSPVSGEGNE